MAKLQRKSAKLFASEATAAAGGLAQFGSLAAGTPNYSTDPDVIQALDAYKEGWSSAVLGTKSPALEDRNALDYLLSYQQTYIMQHGIPEWLDTETYYENSYVVDSNGELRVSVIDNNTGHDPIEDEGGQYWGYAGARGAGKQIGEVYYSQSSLASDNKGGLPLFTGELISNANNLYPQFYAWVLSHTELCKTQAQYDTAISTYGECPYYVIDDTNKTIRLPKLANYVKMANTTDKITQASAGLPNITGTALIGGVGSYPIYISSTSGSLYTTQQSNFMTRGENGGPGPTGLGINASRSSAVYGNSNTVTPAHTTLYPWVCAYNGAAPASVAQAAQFQTALSSKADVDFTNVNGTGSSTAAGWAMPSPIPTSWVNLTLGAAGSTYTMTEDGFVCFGTTGGSVGGYISLSCGYMADIHLATATYEVLRVSLFIPKGATFGVSYASAGSVVAFGYYKLVGGAQ